MAVTTIDEARAGEFAGEMVALLNHSMLCLMISVGHRTELFDTARRRCRRRPAKRSRRRPGLNERYVREWLNAMTVGRIVRVRPGRADLRAPARARRVA